MPVAFATRVPAALVTDRQADVTWLIAESDLSERLSAVLADIENIAPVTESTAGAIDLHEPPASDFLNAVSLAKEHIRAGDIFQANLSRRWTGTLIPVWIRSAFTEDYA